VIGLNFISLLPHEGQSTILFPVKHETPDSWECTKCRHSKNKETSFLSEDSCFEHIKEDHFDAAIKEFADGLK
jgi:hypothetical protein